MEIGRLVWDFGQARVGRMGAMVAQPSRYRRTISRALSSRRRRGGHDPDERDRHGERSPQIVDGSNQAGGIGRSLGSRCCRVGIFFSPEFASRVILSIVAQSASIFGNLIQRIITRRFDGPARLRKTSRNIENFGRTNPISGREISAQTSSRQEVASNWLRSRHAE